MSGRIVFSSLFRLLTVGALLLACLAGAWPLSSAAAQEGPYRNVVEIPVHQGVEQGLESFLRRAMAEAAERQADLVVLHVKTPGGEVNAADSIGQIVREAPMRVIAFIDDHAFSAGTYVALNADEIVMTPGSSMGAAAPVTMTGEAADVKVISAWSEKMAAAARLNDRNPDVARAMVEIDREFPGLKRRGEVLSLDAESAAELGYADRIVANRAELYQSLNVPLDQVQRIDPTLAERVARIVTHPVVMSILLLLGMTGLVAELFLPGFGIPGTIGVISFVLYFFGHYMAGFATWFHIGLFLVGLLLLFLELYLPGGIAGVMGMLCVGAGLVLAAYDTPQGLLAVLIAVLVSAVVGVVLVKKFGFQGVWNRLILRDEQRNDAGYVAPLNYRDLVGKFGVALTPLRPAGIVRIEGRRVDAVSVGGFIAAGAKVSVVEAEGVRVVVQELEQTGKELD